MVRRVCGVNLITMNGYRLVILFCLSYRDFMVTFHGRDWVLTGVLFGLFGLLSPLFSLGLGLWFIFVLCLVRGVP